MKQECLGYFSLGIDILLFHFIFKFKEKNPILLCFSKECLQPVLLVNLVPSA